MTLCISQQHPTTVYITVFRVCVVLVFSVIRCSCYYFFDRILFRHAFHHDSFDYYPFFGHYATPWMFPPLDNLLEYWIEHVTFGLIVLAAFGAVD